jgi:SanA protein
MSRFIKVIAKILGVIVVLGAIVLLAIPPLLYFYYRRYIYVSVDAVGGSHPTGMVLGAAVYPGGTPSSALRERLDTAIELYKAGKIEKILVSGAHDVGYDEPRAMKTALVESGIPPEAIIEDNLGLRTYDSCRRARSEFEITELLVISQGFHLPRALFLCRSFGIQASGVYSVGPFSTYYNRWYTVREVMAMYVAVWDVLRN